MRAVVQRVRRAAVRVDEQVVGRIDAGLLVYVAAAGDDAASDVEYVAGKVAGLRVFPDGDGKMNRSVGDVGGAVLVVSAFTVLADARKGRRPSFDASAPGPVAEPLVRELVGRLEARGLRVETGRFAAYMQVESENDGPICVLLDSRRVI